MDVLLQQYNAMFEAAIEVSMPNQAKGKNLMFEVMGEGNLPRISVLKPAVRNKKGQPLLLFKRSLVARMQSLPLVISNDGTLPSKVDIDMVDPDGVFTISPTGDTQAVIADTDDGLYLCHLSLSLQLPLHAATCYVLCYNVIPHNNNS